MKIRSLKLFRFSAVILAALLESACGVQPLQKPVPPSAAAKTQEPIPPTHTAAFSVISSKTENEENYENRELDLFDDRGQKLNHFKALGGIAEAKIFKNSVAYRTHLVSDAFLYIKRDPLASSPSISWDTRNAAESNITGKIWISRVSEHYLALLNHKHELYIDSLSDGRRQIWSSPSENDFKKMKIDEVQLAGDMVAFRNSEGNVYVLKKDLSTPSGINLTPIFNTITWGNHTNTNNATNDITGQVAKFWITENLLVLLTQHRRMAIYNLLPSGDATVGTEIWHSLGVLHPGTDANATAPTESVINPPSTHTNPPVQQVNEPRAIQQVRVSGQLVAYVTDENIAYGLNCTAQANQTLCQSTRLQYGPFVQMDNLAISKTHLAFHSVVRPGSRGSDNLIHVATHSGFSNIHPIFEASDIRSFRSWSQCGGDLKKVQMTLTDHFATYLTADHNICVFKLGGSGVLWNSKGKEQFAGKIQKIQIDDRNKKAFFTAQSALYKLDLSPQGRSVFSNSRDPVQIEIEREADNTRQILDFDLLSENHIVVQHGSGGNLYLATSDGKALYTTLGQPYENQVLSCEASQNKLAFLTVNGHLVIIDPTTGTEAWNSMDPITTSQAGSAQGEIIQAKVTESYFAYRTYSDQFIAINNQHELIYESQLQRQAEGQVDIVLTDLALTKHHTILLGSGNLYVSDPIRQFSWSTVRPTSDTGPGASPTHSVAEELYSLEGTIHSVKTSDHLIGLKTSNQIYITTPDRSFAWPYGLPTTEPTPGVAPSSLPETQKLEFEVSGDRLMIQRGENDLRVYSTASQNEAIWTYPAKDGESIQEAKLSQNLIGVRSSLGIFIYNIQGIHDTIGVLIHSIPASDGHSQQKRIDLAI